jgi:hypothetical protein
VRSGDLDDATDNLLGYLTAQWRLSARPTDFLADALRITSTIGLSESSRLRALTFGLILCDNANHEDDAHKFWAQRPTEVRSGSDTDAQLLRARMIFHCSFGNPTEGLAAARALSALAHTAGDPTHALRLLSNVADAERTIGELPVALRLLKHIYDRGTALHAPGIAAVAADKLAASHLMLGKVSAARYWVERSLSAGSECDDFDGRHAAIDTLAGIQIAEGDIAGAAGAISLLSDVPEVHGSIRSRRQLATTRAFHHLARTDQRVPSQLLDDLYDGHRAMRNRTMHDRTALALVLALLRSGHKQKARSILSAYLNEERRGGPCIAPDLLVLQATLK